jgi:HEXXH motif-containing protein
VTQELPAGFLALPKEGERTVEALRRKLALVALHTLLTLPPAETGGLAKPFGRFRDWLETVVRGPDKKRLRAAFERVDVLVPVLALRSGLTPPADALRDAVPAALVAFARAVGGRVTESVLWDVPLARLIDAGGERVIQFAPEALGLLVDTSSIELRTKDGARFELPLDQDPEGVRVERPFARLGARATPVISLVDSNPLAMLEEHPEKGGNAIALGEKTLGQWRSGLEDGLALIRDTLPSLHAELSATLERMVPVGWEPERHFSASYREAPGLIYLTLHPSALTLAEAIVHESQHGKLNVLSWFDPLLENANLTWCKSAVRPDLRPLWGVLLAVHAFVPVAAMHLRMLELGHPLTTTEPFERRRAEVIAANAHGLATLRELGRPTELGRRVTDALEALHQHVVAARPVGESGATVSAL